MQQDMTTEAPDIPANDLIFAKEMAEALHSAYPGHLWGVQVNGQGGIATIRNLAISGDWGYVLRLPEIYSMSQFRGKVLRAGGEILERFRLTRGRVDDAQLSALPTDHLGRTIGDRSK